MRILLVILLLPAPLLAQWGRDFDPEAGKLLLRFVKPDLSDDQAEKLIEALKRFDAPEYKPLFLRLLDHPDWHVVHRALFALERYGDPAVIELAWKRLGHLHPRVREKAAITCIRLWDGRPASADLSALIEKERDFHVRECLRALERRATGKLELLRLTEAKAVSGQVPFVVGGHERFIMPAAEGSARNFPPAARFVYPVASFLEDAIDQPVWKAARQRADDVARAAGAFDGGGLYAVADGIVTVIGTLDDSGAGIVVDHHLSDREILTVRYHHAGGLFFVKPGERVRCGQLIGTIGMGWSSENGGTFAHVELTMSLPGGVALEPIRFLKHWSKMTAPLAPMLRGVSDNWGREYAKAARIQDRSEPGSEAFVDANVIVSELKNVPARTVARADVLVATGFCSRALDLLRDIVARCKGVPGLDACRDKITELEKDPAFRKAQKGEQRLAATADRAARAATKAEGLKIWQAFLDQYGDSYLRPRIRRYLDP